MTFKMSGHELTTALIKAAKTGWYHPIADLVAAGANVNYEGDGGFTLLIWAATKGIFCVLRNWSSQERRSIKGMTMDRPH